MLGEQIASVLGKYGAKIATRGQRYVSFHALHREDRDPSCSAYVGFRGVPIVKDHATGEAWSLYAYLQKIGVPAQEAKRELYYAGLWEGRYDEMPMTTKPARKANRDAEEVARLYDQEFRRITTLRPTPTPDPEAYARLVQWLEEQEGGSTDYAESRGIPAHLLDRFNAVALKDGSLAFAQGAFRMGEDGSIRFEAVNLKVRRATGDGPRYYHPISGLPDGIWFFALDDAPAKRGKILYLDEGELNAMVVAAAHLEHPEFQHPLRPHYIVGAPGANWRPDEGFIAFLKESGVDLVLIRGDYDQPGNNFATEVGHAIMYHCPHIKVVVAAGPRGVWTSESAKDPSEVYGRHQDYRAVLRFIYDAFSLRLPGGDIVHRKSGELPRKSRRDRRGLARATRNQVHPDESRREVCETYGYRSRDAQRPAVVSLEEYILARVLYRMALLRGVKPPVLMQAMADEDTRLLVWEVLYGLLMGNGIRACEFKYGEELVEAGIARRDRTSPRGFRLNLNLNALFRYLGRLYHPLRRSLQGLREFLAQYHAREREVFQRTMGLRILGQKWWKGPDPNEEVGPWPGVQRRGSSVRTSGSSFALSPT